jgi:hypothetical protein
LIHARESSDFPVLPVRAVFGTTYVTFKLRGRLSAAAVFWQAMQVRLCTSLSGLNPSKQAMYIVFREVLQPAGQTNETNGMLESEQLKKMQMSMWTFQPPE